MSRTADEAGFARPTVYGHFRNKEELLISIVAEDLATLGRMMRAGIRACEDDGHDEPQHTQEFVAAEKTELAPSEAVQVANDYQAYADEFPHDEIRSAEEAEAEPLELSTVEEVASEPAHHEDPLAEDTAHHEEPAPEPVEEQTPEEISTQDESASVPEQEGVHVEESGERLLQETHELDLDATQNEAEPEPEFESIAAPEPQEEPEPLTTQTAASRLDDKRVERRSTFSQPRVDAWLERRLRVFERTLADLNARIEKVERDSERAHGLVAESMRDVQQHIDSADLRQRQNSESIMRRVEAADQRNLAAIASLRLELQALLNPDGKEKSETVGTPEGEMEFVPTPAMDIPRLKREPSDTFLSAARRAANAAAELAEAERNTGGPLMGGMKWPANDDKRKLYTRYLISGVGILALTLIGAGMMLRHSDVKAVSPLPKIASAHAETLPSRADAPLDRLTALANSGNAQAELIVGLAYMNGGDGKGTNDASAAHWVERAANAHDAVAQYTLGSFYEKGVGVTKDSAQALHWYEAAASQGNRKAMYRLGVVYAEGIGVTKDFAQAVTWFTKAANAGLVDAQFNLAVLYERGQGVPQSLLDAYKWYAIAASHGDKESQSRVEALGAQLSPDDLAAAERSVQEFAPSDFDREANVAPTIADVAGP